MEWESLDQMGKHHEMTGCRLFSSHCKSAPFDVPRLSIPVARYEVITGTWHGGSRECGCITTRGIFVCVSDA